MDARDRLIVALDVSRLSPALELTRSLGADVRWVKVGLELFTAAGPDALQALKLLGKRVFLDLKLHDIPHTVAGAVRAAAHHGVDLLTLHASGGPAMLEAAASARDEMRSPLRLLGVTVLTSLDGTEFPEVYRSPDVAERVQRFADAAVAAKLDGIVCSARDLDRLRGLPEGFLRVTPGIRPAGGAAGDQARVATPAEALARGATHLVVGRPITGAEDPAAAARAVLDDMS